MHVSVFVSVFISICSYLHIFILPRKYLSRMKHVSLAGVGSRFWLEMVMKGLEGSQEMFGAGF